MGYFRIICLVWLSLYWYFVFKTLIDRWLGNQIKVSKFSDEVFVKRGFRNKEISMDFTVVMDWWFGS